MANADAFATFSLIDPKRNHEMANTMTQSVADDLRNLMQCLEDQPEIMTHLGVEMAQLTGRLADMCRRPPSMKTRDFHQQGERMPLSADGDGTPASVLERIIDESDLLPVWFMEKGVVVQRSVARIVLTRSHRGFPAGTGFGTGFLVSPTLFLTNNHVIPDTETAGRMRMQFNYQLEPDGSEREPESFLPDFDDLFETNAALDYTLVRLKPMPGTADAVNPGDRWGVIPLSSSPCFRDAQHLNVIQHPSGRLKQVALQNNLLIELFENTVRYETDTEPGSSGSPVFNNLWELVALHHSAGEFDDSRGMFVNNEGIRIDRVVDDLRQSFGAREGGQVTLDELRI